MTARKRPTPPERAEMFRKAHASVLRDYDPLFKKLSTTQYRTVVRRWWIGYDAKNNPCVFTATGWIGEEYFHYSTGTSENPAVTRRHQSTLYSNKEAVLSAFRRDLKKTADNLREQAKTYDAIAATVGKGFRVKKAR